MSERAEVNAFAAADARALVAALYGMSAGNGDFPPSRGSWQPLAVDSIGIWFAAVRLTHVESAPLPVSLELTRTKRKEGTAAMKQQAIQYLALDVHQATVVASLRDEHGRVVMRATVA